jgi:hypothetical protein
LPIGFEIAANRLFLLHRVKKRTEKDKNGSIERGFAAVLCNPA